MLRALPQFVEQPRVLDGDNGLIGERLEHRALLVREWAGRAPRHAQGADRGIAAHHRHDRDRAIAARQEVAGASRQFRRWIFEVRNVPDPAIANGGAYGWL